MINTKLSYQQFDILAADNILGQLSEASRKNYKEKNAKKVTMM